MSFLKCNSHHVTHLNKTFQWLLTGLRVTQALSWLASPLQANAAHLRQEGQEEGHQLRKQVSQGQVLALWAPRLWRSYWTSPSLISKGGFVVRIRLGGTQYYSLSSLNITVYVV